VPTAKCFVDAGISFADEVGNIHLALGDEYNWTVIGERKPPKAPESERITPAAVQLLFQFATSPESAGWTESPAVTPELRDRLISGYSQILRPKLLIGRYRYEETSLDQFVPRLSHQAAAQKIPDALTGGPAADAMQHFYCSAEVPVFLDAKWQRSLRLLPDRTGPVMLFKPFGNLVYWREFEGKMVAPPWLVYAELLTGSDPRAREAAEEFRQEYLK
jgi:hypothetical protein